MNLLTKDNLADMDIFDVIGAGMDVNSKNQKRHNDTHVSIGDCGGFTSHDDNYGALLAMNKAGLFKDPWTVAKWLANMDIHEEEYVLLLQKKYGDFGPDFPAPVKFAAYEYEEGNEDTEEIYCIIDGNSDPEAAFVKAFMSDFAIKFLFKKAEQLDNENTKLKAELDTIKKQKTGHVQANNILYDVGAPAPIKFSDDANREKLKDDTIKSNKINQKKADQLQIKKLQQKMRRDGVEKRKYMRNTDAKLRKIKKQTKETKMSRKKFLSSLLELHEGATGLKNKSFEMLSKSLR